MKKKGKIKGKKREGSPELRFFIYFLFLEVKIKKFNHMVLYKKSVDRFYCKELRLQHPCFTKRRFHQKKGTNAIVEESAQYIFFNNKNRINKK